MYSSKKLELCKTKSVLEIGVGTGRLAYKIAPFCGEFYGIDFSKKSIEQASKNLSDHHNITLICNDFMSHSFDRLFDVIYSSLTFMHIADKELAINKIAALLHTNGRFVLSIDKSQSETLDYGTRRLRIYPDSPHRISAAIQNCGLILLDEIETELAYIFVCVQTKVHN